MAGNGGFLLTAPLGVVLFGRELMRWGTVKDWRQYALFLGGWGLGLGTIVFWAAWAWRFGGWTLYGSRWELLAAMAQGQVTSLLPWVRAVPMLLLYGCVTVVPWWLLFVGSSCRSPWFYERGQVVMRVLLGGLLLAGLYNWMVAPWKLAGGMLDPALAPTALNAACMGYLAGEFWILGERKPLADAGKKKFIRGVATAVGALAPVAVLGAVWMNAAWVMGDRKGDGVWSAACGILDSRGDRDIVFAGPPFDDALLLAVKERGEDVQVVRLGGRAKKPYLERQAAAFPMKEVREACAEGAWERIFPLWSTYPGGLERTIVVPGTEAVRAWAHPLPVGYAWHLEPLDGGMPPETVLALQRPIWQHQAEWLKRRLDAESPAYYFRAMMCSVIARNLNDLGVEFAETGDVRTAARLWGLAMKFQETHLAAAMNRVMAKRVLRGRMPEGTDDEAIPGDLRDTRGVIAWLGKCEEWLITHASTPRRQRATHWSIALQYGLVWKAETWMRAGYPWAGSGMAPAKGNPFLKHESHVLVGLAGNDPLARWIDTVCLKVGTQEVKPEYVYAALCARPGDTELLGMLAWHYLRRGEWEFAASHIREAERASTGTGTFPMRFEQVLTDAMRAGILPHLPEEGARTGRDGFLWPALWYPEGTEAKARAQRKPFTLEEAMLATAQAIPTDPRPWMALWMEGVEGADRWYAERILAEQGLSNGYIGLSMAFGAMMNGDVPTAKKELFKSMSRTEKNPIFWRLLYDIATAEGNKKLAAGAEKRLRLMIPELNKSGG